MSDFAYENNYILTPILQMAKASTADAPNPLNSPPATRTSHNAENLCDENANTPLPSEAHLSGFTLPLTDEQEADESIIADEESEKPGGNYPYF